MTTESASLHVLLVEDDTESLGLLMKTLPTNIAGFEIQWEPCDNFDEAVKRATSWHYDVIVTDIYRDRTGGKKGAEVGDEKAKDVIASVRKRRFCPVVAFTDGSAPQTFNEGPFIRLADKTTGNADILAKMEDLLKTGIPAIARKLHDEIDGVSCPYLWDFLEANWSRLQDNGVTDPAILERLIRRRVALQIGRLSPSPEGPAEVGKIEGVEFYIYPPIASDIRLGEVSQHTKDKTFRVVLNPHCHLAVQPGDDQPRAEYVLTVKAIPARDVISRMCEKPWRGNEPEKMDDLRRRVQSPADRLGKPKGRFWFLPAFLDIPDMYCDFQQLESVEYKTFQLEYARIAVLDAPFAEALQSCFAQFYLDVGIPGLNVERFKRLIK